MEKHVCSYCPMCNNLSLCAVQVVGVYETDEQIQVAFGMIPAVHPEGEVVCPSYSLEVHEW